jgi:hypothetical protein
MAGQRRGARLSIEPDGFTAGGPFEPVLAYPQEIPPVNEPNMPPPTLPEDEPVPVEDPPANPVPTDKPLRM